MKRILFSVMGLMALKSNFSQTVSLQGEPKKWHKVTLKCEMAGSGLSETNTTFRNYRLDVTFTKGTRSIVVPGYFAADGDAANSSASSGKVWYVHFRPDEVGTWNYSVSFKTGTDVAINGGGTVVGGQFDGKTGSITVTETDKALPDLRAAGRLEYVGKQFYQYKETGKYFLKIGPDSPENFLDYADFDFATTRDNCGTKCFQHSYNPHASNWSTGDPTWKTNKGKNIVGAINYISSKGANSVSMTVFGGDDKNVFMWNSTSNKSIFDVSKLAQWEILFDHIEKKGLLMHWKLAEAENWDMAQADWKLMYREIAARFGHHLAVEYNIGEEFGGVNSVNIPQETTEIKNRAIYMNGVDAYKNPRVAHSAPGIKQSFYSNLISNNAPIQGASLQIDDVNTTNKVYDETKQWVEASKDAGKNWVCANDEQGPAGTGVFSSGTNLNGSLIDNGNPARQKTLWGNHMAGGAGVMWYYGGDGDFKVENFAVYDQLHAWQRICVNEFFHGQNIPFWEMTVQNGLVGTNARCLAKVGQSYVIYLAAGGTSSLNLAGQTGTFNVKWFDPKTGGALKNGSVTSVNGGGSAALGSSPSPSAQDWVILVTKSGAGTGNQAPSVTVSASPTTAIAPANVALSATALDADGSVAKVEFFVNNVLVSTDVTSPYTHNLQNLAAGTYQVKAVATDNLNLASAPITVTVTISNQSSTPTDITDLAAVVTNCPNVTLSWSDVSGETGYRIRRRLPSQTTFTNIADVAANATSYQDNSAVQGTTYVYMVRPLVAGTAVAISNTPTIAVPNCNVTRIGALDELNQNLVISPNPFGDVINLDFGNEYDLLSIELINELGQVEKTVSVTGTHTSYSLNTTDLESGIYLVKITTVDGFVIQKVIK